MYVCDGDKNGVLRFIGTGYGAQVGWAEWGDRVWGTGGVGRVGGLDRWGRQSGGTGYGAQVGWVGRGL